jgi:hypothetical protein
MVKNLAAEAFALLFSLVFASSAHAQCTQYYDSTVAVPAGWGAAYDVFTPGNPLLESVNCSSLPNVQLVVGTSILASQRIWHLAYLSKDGATWAPINLSSASQQLPDGYFSGQATATLNLTSADLANWN